MTLAAGIWVTEEHVHAKESDIPMTRIEAVEESLKSARLSQRNAKNSFISLPQENKRPEVMAYSSCSIAKVTTWLQEMKEKKGADDRLVLNESQYKVVELVATRVCTEIETFNSQDFTLPENEPLRWVMHGGPGTGKTHVIKIIKDGLFQDILGWNIGVEFQVVALQAVMADLLGGDTIHHALNIPIYGKIFTAEKDQTRPMSMKL